MVNQRRKINKQCLEVSLCRSCESPLMITDRRQPLVTRISDLDENALRARQWLEQKLGASSRSSVLPQKKSSGRNHKAGMKGTCLGSKLLGSQWPLKLRRCKSYWKICSVCLEGFQDNQQIDKLSYYCVLPCLAAHPHCPHCRNTYLGFLIFTPS